MKKSILLLCLLLTVVISGCHKQKSLDEMSDDERDAYFEERMNELNDDE